MTEDKFYVYFNDRNLVTGISPNNDEFLSGKFKYTKVPYNEVKPFITGEKRQAEAMVSLVEGSMTKYFVTTRSSKEGMLYDYNQGLTEISEKLSEYDVQIKFIGKDLRKIEINLSRETKKLIKNKTIIDVPLELAFHLTQKDDYDSWIYSILVPVEDLLKRKQTFTLDKDQQLPSQFSLVTRKYFDNYSCILPRK